MKKLIDRYLNELKNNHFKNYDCKEVDEFLIDYDSNVQMYNHNIFENRSEDSTISRKLEEMAAEFDKTLEEIVIMFNVISSDLDKLSENEKLIKISYDSKIEFTKSLLEMADEMADMINTE